MRVGTQLRGVLVGKLRQFPAASRLQVFCHALVERENRGSRTDLGTHVADSPLAGAGDAGGAGAEIFDNVACAALDGQGLAHFQDDVLG